MNGKNQLNFLNKYKKYKNIDYENSNVKLDFLLKRVKSLQKTFTKSLEEMQKNIEEEIKDEKNLKKLQDLTGFEDPVEIIKYECECLFDDLYDIYKDEVKFGGILWNLKDKFLKKEMVETVDEINLAKNLDKNVKDNGNENIIFFIKFYFLGNPVEKKEPIEIEMNNLNKGKN